MLELGLTKAAAHETPEALSEVARTLGPPVYPSEPLRTTTNLRRCPSEFVEAE